MRGQCRQTRESARREPSHSGSRHAFVRLLLVLEHLAVVAFRGLLGRARLLGTLARALAVNLALVAAWPWVVEVDDSLQGLIGQANGSR